MSEAQESSRAGLGVVTGTRRVRAIWNWRGSLHAILSPNGSWGWGASTQDTQVHVVRHTAKHSIVRALGIAGTNPHGGLGEHGDDWEGTAAPCE